MKNIKILFLLLIASTVCSQEQISNVIGDGNVARYILKEHNEKKYILTTFPSDSIMVYEVVNGSPIFLHSSHFSGIYRFTTYNTLNDCLLFSESRGSVAYNFADNIIHHIPYGPGHVYTRWNEMSAFGDVVLLYQSPKDFVIKKNIRFNLKTGEAKTISSDYQYMKLTEDKLYGYKYINESTYHIYVLDKETMTILDSTKTPILYGSQHFFDGDKYLVYFSEGKLNRYNFETKSHENISTVTTPYRSVYINQSNNEYVMQVTLDFDKQVMVRIDKSSLTSTQNEILHRTEPTLPGLYYNKYVTPGSRIFITDISTGMSTNFYSGGRKESTIILENRYLVYYDFYDHKILDLATMDIHTLSAMPERINSNNLEVLKDNETYFINYDNSSGNNKKLYELNIDQKTGNYCSKIHSTNEGLLKGSKLLKIGNDLIVANQKNLYYVKENSIIPLNTKPLHKVRYTEYKVEGEALFWCEFLNEEYQIHTFQNGTYAKIASIPNDFGDSIYHPRYLYDYSVTPDEVLFTTFYFENKVYSFNIKNQEITEQADNQKNFYFGIYYSRKYYYIDNNKIVILHPNGAIKTIDIDSNLSISTPFTIFKDRLYYINSENLYEITDDKLLTLKTFNDESILFIETESDYIKMIRLNNDYIYNGNELYKLPSTYNSYTNKILATNFIVYYTGTGTNTTKAYMYDIRKKLRRNLPAHIEKLQNIFIFSIGGRYIIGGSDGFTPFHKPSFFETDQNLTFFDKLGDFDFANMGSTTTFTSHSNQGFLYAGSAMYILDTSFNIIPINHLKGENESNTVFQKDGYFYFVAIHRGNGRQLFRIPVFSTTSSENIFDEVLKIHPNPTSQVIILPDENWCEATIIDISGNLVLKAEDLTSNTIDVSFLKTGTYILNLISKKGKKGVSKFIKVN